MSNFDKIRALRYKENPNKLRQKDVDARWTKKRGDTYYGYKNHINVDAKHKLVRTFVVTDASTCDANCLEELLYDKNSDKKLWADSIYRAPKTEILLFEKGFLDRMHYRAKPGDGVGFRNEANGKTDEEARLESERNMYLDL